MKTLNVVKEKAKILKRNRNHLSEIQKKAVYHIKEYDTSNEQD